ncbi:hypothetical protein GCM10009745_35680 [Kribbella yunnanensis]|uniref:Uncharacterized protein n=2 Tax=Kribbella yunnanensis TaxID=190194 RepID=A0ABN2HGW1_9ACTN
MSLVGVRIWRMSYDLVVWAGERPADGDALEELYEELMELQEDNDDDETPPNPRLVEFANALLARWPEASAGGPWVVEPLIADAVGDLFPFGVQFEYAGEVAEYAAVLAEKHGLVLFDPQNM